MDTTGCADHRWKVTSRHRTSEGVISYARCRCGAHRVLRAGRVEDPEVLVVVAGLPPAPLPVSGPPGWRSGDRVGAAPAARSEVGREVLRS